MSDESKQFVDTNVLVYAHDRSAGEKQETARTLLRTLWQDRSGCLSIQVLQEFYVTVTRKVTHPLSAEAASQIIADLATWEVHRPGVNDVLEAIQLHTSQHLSFWDAMILTSARQLGCQITWSEDMADGQVYEDVRVRNPFR